MESRVLLSSISAQDEFSAGTVALIEQQSSSGVPDDGSITNLTHANSSRTNPSRFAGLGQQLNSFETLLPDLIRVGQPAFPFIVDLPHSPNGGRLDIWIDWNRDGYWGGPAEYVAGDWLKDGRNTLLINVPAWAQTGKTKARFQLDFEARSQSWSSLIEGKYQEFELSLHSPVYPSGRFETAIPINKNAYEAWALASGDLDRDGDADIVSASYEDNTIEWYSNDGIGNFITHVISTAVAEASSVAILDSDRDGDWDIVASSLFNNSIYLFQNDGQQQFVPLMISNSATEVSCVFVADVDRDEDPDILSASRGNDTIAWYENLDGKTFSKHIISTTADGACSVSAADLDFDGDLDVVSASFFDDSVAWYENLGDQTFNKRVISQSADGARGVTISDIDRDGDQDILSSSLFDNTVALYLNDGKGVFTEVIVSDNARNAVSVFASDMDGDGDLDVLSTTRADNSVSWFENTGSSQFPRHWVTDQVGGAHAAIAIDVDSDGDLDVVSAAQFGNQVAWHENFDQPTPLGLYFFSSSAGISNDQVIRVEAVFSRPINGLSVDSFTTQNGSIFNLTGSGSIYAFDLMPHQEGSVSVTLPAGTVTSLEGYSNGEANFQRVYDIAPPVLGDAEGSVIYVRNGPPIALVPLITVEESRLAGGTLVVVSRALNRNRRTNDVINDESLNGLGIVSRSNTGNKRTVSVTLHSTIAAEEIEHALRQLTFSTTQRGSRARSRVLHIQLTDAAGRTSPVVNRVVQIRRR